VVIVPFSSIDEATKRVLNLHLERAVLATIELRGGG
jgi:hypothetical protein